MKRRILLVGEDPALLETRALLLSAWETSIRDTRSALAAIQSETFDVVIVGQLVTAENARLLISAARKREPVPEILAIRNANNTDALGVETHRLDPLESPGWLPEWVKAALDDRSRRAAALRVLLRRAE